MIILRQKAYSKPIDRVLYGVQKLKSGLVEIAKGSHPTRPIDTRRIDKNISKKNIKFIRELPEMKKNIKRKINNPGEVVADGAEMIAENPTAIVGAVVPAPLTTEAGVGISKLLKKYGKGNPVVDGYRKATLNAKKAVRGSRKVIETATNPVRIVTKPAGEIVKGTVNTAEKVIQGDIKGAGKEAIDGLVNTGKAAVDGVAITGKELKEAGKDALDTTEKVVTKIGRNIPHPSGIPNNIR